MSYLSVHQLHFIFGLLGNLISFMVFLAPMPTFWTIYKKKTAEGFQSIPYLVALMSAMLLLYYGALKTNAILLISINSFGCFIELVYIALYLFYAPKREKILTMKLFVVFDLGFCGVILGGTMLFLHGMKRTNAVGLICAAFNLSVFASPLSIMKRVITTKSVEFMSFPLSFFLTLSAVMWFFYGFFMKDLFIALPNIVGFLLGMIQMIIYMIYRDKKVNSFGGKEGNLEEGDKKYEGNYQNAPTIENQEINMVKTNSNI
ncbi:bidirectional sugar transporter NEC1-like [Cucurbita pepo subsp. pepo]|uniref:bidirectional sugar transporter NEC1-like n=1 Tax=Cucurbita pepo subsp. pepo TaxID=3664 RepID=UPI000C9D6816|nr:bidirectional sugar transporter NEC1-like [Cucurbita pepo subsp. pepo]